MISPAAARYVELLSVFTRRQVKARYRGSWLGVFWSLLNPLIMTILYTLVFGRAFSKYYHDSTTLYTLAVFVGLVVNGFFSSSTSQALQAVVANSSLANKVKLPFSIYPTSLVAASGFQFVVGAVPFLILVTVLVTHSVANVLLLIFPVVSLGLVSLGFGFLTSALFVFFRDVPYLYELVTFVAFVATPTFYPIGIVAPRFRPFIEWNPLTQIIEGIRNLALLNQVPPPFQILEPLCAGLVLSIAGWLIFRRLSQSFMDYL